MSLPTMAQSAKGGISPEILQRIESANAQTPTSKALQNAISQNQIKKLTANSDNRFMFDREFSHRVKSKGITDQKSSGRCWLFTGLNVYRAKVIQTNDLSDFRFSHVYSFFFDQLEKCNLFLQGVIDHVDKPMDDKMVEWLFKHPLNDGGQYTGVSDILTKYGVVPTEAMPETYNSENTSEMGRILGTKLCRDGLLIREAHAKGAKVKKLQEMKEQTLAEIYRILCYCLGTPPKKFEYTLRNSKGEVISTKEYTPKTFFDEFIGDDLTGNYVMLMNDPSRPFGKLYEIDYDRHTYDGRNWTYVNLPIEEIKEMAIASIKGNDAMYFSCDVGKELNPDHGTLDMTNYEVGQLFGISLDMSKKDRIRTFTSGSTHAMTLVAVDLDKDGKPKKWMVENSWGDRKGYQGHLIMTDRWFEEYMFRVVVHKKYVTDKVKNILKTKPTRLPAWDPMFAGDE
ncbi:aminopeptidase C [Porphyromonas sp.]|uniref:aminopeptidase C n=1 Tax=Porphyromonas sp. TaxID=1924944 RepID=UPI0026DB7B22|nr:C1 family peptidase [Porphyromonas sp.]MDO4771855.1 C1 family peptidase [Porphyromonas sp.]